MAELLRSRPSLRYSSEAAEIRGKTHILCIYLIPGNSGHDRQYGWQARLLRASSLLHDDLPTSKDGLHFCGTNARVKWHLPVTHPLTPAFLAYFVLGQAYMRQTRTSLHSWPSIASRHRTTTQEPPALLLPEMAKSPVPGIWVWWCQMLATHPRMQQSIQRAVIAAPLAYLQRLRRIQYCLRTLGGSAVEAWSFTECKAAHATTRGANDLALGISSISMTQTFLAVI